MPLEQNSTLQHVAIIMDGNGRWAKKRLLPRSAGHKQGAKVVEQICEDAWDLGIKYLTVYAFSTENWSRSQEEVYTLMNLLRAYMKNCIERSAKNNMRVRVLGDISKLDDDLKESIRKLEEASKDATGLQFQVAINYGGRDELLRAVTSIARDIGSGKLDESAICDELISDRLDTHGIPDPDLLIRTSGEQRLSNFLLWQSAYTELYFTDVLWPDFDKHELEKAIQSYQGRNRRFGKL